MPPRIMVVEDESIVAMDIQRTLEKLGYTVPGLASSGEDAMMKVVQLKPNLVLMDIRLKGSFDGIETANRIKKLVGVPVIFLTAHFDEEMLKRAAITEPFGYIFKPFDEKELQIAIEIALYKAKIDQSLKESEKNLKHAASLAHLGYWERDIKTNAVTWSDEQFRIFGYTPTEVSATFELVMKHIHPQDKESLLQTIANSLEKKTPYNIEYRIVRTDGAVRWLQAQADITYDDFDNPAKLTGTSLDITDRKVMEQKLFEEKERAEEATKLKDQFVSLVAHDLMTPLTAMTGFLKVIRGDINRGNIREMESFLDMTLKNAENMSALIEDVLNINKLRSGKIALRQMFQDGYLLVEQLITHLMPMANKKGVALKNKIKPKTRIYADPILIYEVLQNLFTNAIKFSASGGTITAYSPEDKPGTISIADEGIGIPPDRISEVFALEKKTSTPGTEGEEGSGYGLPLSLDIVRAHGGNITAESTPGKGSVFHVTLPIAKPLVLLVDDEMVSRAIYRHYLELLNVEVVEAENGAKALEMLNVIQPHLIISDIIMPVMDGYQFLEAVRKDSRFEKVPFIAVTAKPDLESSEKIFKLGANDFVAKKAAPEDFLARAGRYLV